MIELELTVPGVAAPAGSKRPGRTKDGRLFVRDDSRRTAPWKDRVASEASARMAGRELLAGPLAVRMVFYLPRPKGHYGTGRNAGILKPSAPLHPTTKPDTTKLVRAAEDALKGIVWRDDSQVVYQKNRKAYGEPARAVIQVSRLAQHTRLTDAACMARLAREKAEGSVE